MKPQKDIFDLFRKNEHKLQEAPSSEAWGKLERRLERQRSRRTILPFSNLFLAASVVGILVIVTLMSGIFTDSNADAFAASKAQARQLEDLAAEMDPASVEALIEFQRTYEEQITENPVVEGSVEKKLVVRP